MTVQEAAREAPASRIVRVGIGAVALVAYLPSGLLVLFAIVLPAAPGAEGSLLIAQAVDAGGWVLLGTWLLRDLYRLRIRVLLPPVIAWLWAWTLVRFIANSGLIVWGY